MLQNLSFFITFHNVHGMHVAFKKTLTELKKKQLSVTCYAIVLFHINADIMRLNLDFSHYHSYIISCIRQLYLELMSQRR